MFNRQINITVEEVNVLAKKVSMKDVKFQDVVYDL